MNRLPQIRETPPLRLQGDDGKPREYRNVFDTNSAHLLPRQTRFLSAVKSLHLQGSISADAAIAVLTLTTNLDYDLWSFKMDVIDGTVPFPAPISYLDFDVEKAVQHGFDPAQVQQTYNMIISHLPSYLH